MKREIQETRRAIEVGDRAALGRCGIGMLAPLWRRISWAALRLLFSQTLRYQAQNMSRSLQRIFRPTRLQTQIPKNSPLRHPRGRHLHLPSPSRLALHVIVAMKQSLRQTICTPSLFPSYRAGREPQESKESRDSGKYEH